MEPGNREQGSNEPSSLPDRRRMQFSLRQLLGLVTGFAVCLSFFFSMRKFPGLSIWALLFLPAIYGYLALRAALLSPRPPPTTGRRFAIFATMVWGVSGVVVASFLAFVMLLMGGPVAIMFFWVPSTTACVASMGALTSLFRGHPLGPRFAMLFGLVAGWAVGFQLLLLLGWWDTPWPVNAIPWWIAWGCTLEGLLIGVLISFRIRGFFGRAIRWAGIATVMMMVIAAIVLAQFHGNAFIATAFLMWQATVVAGMLGAVLGAQRRS